MDWEAARSFWEKQASKEDVLKIVCKMDAVLRFFDAFDLLELIDGKSVRFDIDKLAELQDKVDVLPRLQGDVVVREIFDPSATKNVNVRSHKLTKVMQDALSRIAEEGNLPVPDTAPKSENMAEGKGDEVKGLCLQVNPELPEGAALNVRQQPFLDSEVVSKLFIGDTVTAMQLNGDWAQIHVEGDSAAWVLMRTSGQELLVPAEPGSRHEKDENQNMQQTVPKQNQTPVKAPQQPPQPQEFQMATPQPQRFHAHQNEQNLALTPLQDGDDPNRPVSLVEHNRLRYKVAQMEQDIRALRLLLRSWSLETPSAAVPPPF